MLPPPDVSFHFLARLCVLILAFSAVYDASLTLLGATGWSHPESSPGSTNWNLELFPKPASSSRSDGQKKQRQRIQAAGGELFSKTKSRHFALSSRGTFALKTLARKKNLPSTILRQFNRLNTTVAICLRHLREGNQEEIKFFAKIPSASLAWVRILDNQWKAIDPTTRISLFAIGFKIGMPRTLVFYIPSI